MKNPRVLWLLGYLLVNIIGYFIMASTGFLIGDVDGVPVYNYNSLFFAAITTIFFYYLLMGPCFNFITKIKTRRVAFNICDNKLSDRISLFLMAAQLCFFCFNVSQGVNVAGAGNHKAQGPFSFLWVLLPVDALFLIYYSIYRNSRYFTSNFLIWLASNLYRGWAGVFLFILFFEFCRLFRERKLSFIKSMLILFFTLLLYPIINVLKWTIRGFAGGEFDFFLLLGAVTDYISLDEYLSLVSDGFNHLVGRVQTTSMLVEVMRLQPVLSKAFENSNFIPFWKEGIIGIAYDTLIYGVKGIPLNVIFPMYANLGSIDDLGNWNTNTGFASWLLIAPLWSPIYIFYVLALCFISSFLMKKLSSSSSAMDGLWFAWLMYLLPPWFGAFIGYIQALFIFYILTYILGKIPSFRFQLSS